MSEQDRQVYLAWAGHLMNVNPGGTALDQQAMEWIRIFIWLDG